MRSKKEIIKSAKERIDNLEYFDTMVGLADGKRGDLALMKELVALVESQIGNDPREPHPYIAFDGIERNGCPRCFEELGRNEILYAGQRFCSVCGQAIKRS